MADQEKYVTWALEQVAQRTPGGPLDWRMALTTLIDTTHALHGVTGRPVFGLSPDQFDAKSVETIRVAAVQALVKWKEHFEATDNLRERRDLHELGEKLSLPQLRMADSELPKPRSQPFGSAERLDGPWKRRILALREARENHSVFAFRSVGIEDAGSIEVLQPDLPALERRAINYEMANATATFPQEISAVWSVIGGIALGGEPLLRGPADWDDYDFGDGGLVLGAGSYVQGSLVLTPRADDEFGGPVIDYDDDGVELARYPSLGAFFDKLLGIR